MDRTQRLIHPAVVGSIALLALNDHVLKARWPGLATGKVSDLAGLFAVAVAAAVIAGPNHRRRSAAAIVAVGVAFTGLKLVPAVAALAAPVLGGATVSDPTDLVALAVLPAAHRLVRSQRTPPEPVRSQRTPPEPVRTQRTDRPAGGLQMLAATLAVTAGTFSVTATSCLEAEQVTGFALVRDGVVAGVGEPGAPATSTRYLSTDGGQTWAVYAPPVAGSAPPTLVAQKQICLDGTRCYRVADNDRVEQRDDSGQWHTAFSFTDEQIRRMRLRSDSCSGRGEPTEMFAFLTPTGPTSPSDPDPASPSDNDRPTVLVSMATQGVLRLDPDTGRWERLPVGRAEPLSLRGPSWMADLSKLPLLFLLITPALYLVRRKQRPRRQRVVLAVVATTVAAAIGLATLGVLVITLGAADYAVFGATVAALSVTAFLISLAVALRPPRGDAAGPSRGDAPARR